MMISLKPLLDFLSQHPSVSRLYVGFSGGTDSLVLLHLLTQEPLLKSYKVCGIHVHHGLSPHANEWEKQCEAWAHTWGVSFFSHHLDLKKKKGKSLEHAARILRYEVFAEYMDEGSILLTAHHQKDQAETLLLQLLRGAGPKGLAAMAFSNGFASSWHLRPLLNEERSSLETYAEYHGLKGIHDESNDDIHFDRNYLRHEVFPRILERWPGAFKTMARSARHCGDALLFIEEVAERDFKHLWSENKISLNTLANLPTHRQQEVLRYAMGYLKLPLCSEEVLLNILHTMYETKEDGVPFVAWPGGEARRYQGFLYLLKPVHFSPPKEEIGVRVGEPQVFSEMGASLKWEEVRGGLSFSFGDPLSLDFRKGNARFHPKNRAHSQDLKKLMQEWKIPPWERKKIPLLYEGKDLVAVLGYSLHKTRVVSEDIMGWLPVWETGIEA